MQGVMKAQKKLDTNSDRREQKQKQPTGSSINNMATMQLKNMLNLNSKSNGSDSRMDDQRSKQEIRSNPRDVPENTKRLPMGPPDNTTKGFAIKRTVEHKSLPKVRVELSTRQNLVTIKYYRIYQNQYFSWITMKR